MRLGIVGLRDIATKAYLPILSLKENIELVFCSRNVEVLNTLAKKYKVSEYVQTVDELIKLKVDAVMVCRTANAHFDIVKKLIENNINVYVDKPISFNLEETK